MAAFDFPDTTGQATDGSFQYDAGGFTYAWNGEVWNIVGGGAGGGDTGGGASVNVGVNPPSGSEQGDLWFNTNNGRLHIYYGPDPGGTTQWVDVSLLSTNLFTDYLPLSGGTVTGDLTVNGDSVVDGNSSVGGDLTVDGDVQATSFNGGPLAGFRNHIINGDFSIQQRYSTAAAWQGLSHNVYTADRWQTGGTLVDVAWVFGTDSLPFRSRMTVTNKLAGNNSGLSQLIEMPASEGYGPFTPNAQFVLSFWSDTALTAGGSTVSVDILDFTSNTFIASATTTLIGAVEGPLSGFTRYAYSVTIPSYTFDPNYAVRVNIYQGITAINTAFSFTGVQLEPGPVATPFEHRPIGTELALCQRYFQALGYVGSRQNPVSNTPSLALSLLSPMRVTPDMEGTYAGNGDSATISGLSTVSYQMTSATAGTLEFLGFSDITADAEL